MRVSSVAGARIGAASGIARSFASSSACCVNRSSERRVSAVTFAPASSIASGT